ncbi:porin [Caballeronia sp. dw_19]|uniref:porin n=1 Tax=Caballeronia sp. dw_19 TaxID=2719791 RepID=UPI001BCF531A|nr:porin [Caballeronia sp. dw_19]
MKKMMLTLALGAVAGAANAQSSVTLYGIVDDGIQYSTNQGGHSEINMQSGALGASNWGLTGAEDIGDGVKVVFRVENGFTTNNGAFSSSGYEFNRQAYVGLDGPYGVVKLGRQYDLSYLDGVGPLAAPIRVAGGLGDSPADMDNLFGDFNIQNAVKYITPDLGGAHFGALYGFGNTAGAVSQKQVLNFISTYARGPVSLAAGYMKVNRPATAVWGGSADAVANSAFSDPLTNPINSGYASARSLQIVDLGASYSFNPLVLGAVLTQTSYQNVVRTSSTPFSGTAIFRTAEVNASAFITPALYGGVATSYTYSDTAHYVQVDAGLKYSLSKATRLYLIGAWQHAAGTNSLGKSAVADLNGFVASTTNNQLAFRVGIRHSF